MATLVLEEDLFCWNNMRHIMLSIELRTLGSFSMDKYEVTFEKWTEVRTWGLNAGYTDFLQLIDRLELKMAKNISTIILNAPIDKVWGALTNPKIVKQWQYGSDLITDWNVGSEIRFRAEWNGQVFEQWGKVMEIVPYTRIRYSLFAPRPGLEDIPENYFIMNYILTEEKNSTRLVIMQEDDRQGAVQESPQGEENPVLSALKAIIES